MWHVRILDKQTNKTFEKDFPTYEYESFKRKCKYSKKLQIVSELRIW